ncbi:hypothetical protein E2C01_008933 [Portunus trituberculatus]|uniref:Uncharacterized protein n=1 Tax=Portunus trituberculatus TaxID=210409 RepID=A0A5B7D463_PORTR|nr:hypothetical protein [Portunus trituberculatus]
MRFASRLTRGRCQDEEREWNSGSFYSLLPSQCSVGVRGGYVTSDQGEQRVVRRPYLLLGSLGGYSAGEGDSNVLRGGTLVGSSPHSGLDVAPQGSAKHLIQCSNPSI